MKYGDIEVIGDFIVFGETTGSDQGGKITLNTTDDYDDTIESYQIQAYQDDLYIGRSTNSDDLVLLGSGQVFLSQNEGNVWIGKADTYRGTLNLYSNGTGSALGGSVEFHIAADYDTTITQYKIQAYEDDFYFGRSTNTDDNILWADGSISLTRNEGNVYVGWEDITRGILHLFGHATGTTTGGELRLYASADHDTTYDYFQMYNDSANVYMGFDGFGTMLSFAPASSGINITKGILSVGVNDTTRGSLYLYGNATGSTLGGNITIYTSADYDSTINNYVIKAEEDDLWIGPLTDLDAIVYEGSTNTLNISASGGVQLASGAAITEFSIDGTLADDSDTAVPTEKAVKTYVDAQAGSASTTRTVEEKTTDYTVLTSDTSKVLILNSASNYTFTLPSVDGGDNGTWYTFVRKGDGRVTIDAADSDIIHDSGAGYQIYCDTVGESYSNITVVLEGGDHWVVIAGVGTWTTTES